MIAVNVSAVRAVVREQTDPERGTVSLRPKLVLAILDALVAYQGALRQEEDLLRAEARSLQHDHAPDLTVPGCRRCWLDQRAHAVEKVLTVVRPATRRL